MGRVFKVEDTNETNFECSDFAKMPLQGMTRAELVNAFAMSFFQESDDKPAEAEKLVAELSRIAETPS